MLVRIGIEACGPCSTMTLYDVLIVPVIKISVVTAMIFHALNGLSMGSWDDFIVAAPFAIAVAPGYLTAFTNRQKQHGDSCDCEKSDSKCELLFWLQQLQIAFLFMPPALLSMFLFYYLQQDMQSAVTYTVTAAFTMLAYSLACFFGFYVLSVHRTP